ncbi:dipeptide ABC transporter ATP-binding protein [Arthrobacter crystallopoietes]|uniref:Peptide/nickel transport system ATP-binding protein n=1 Tax=Crystallibacter crystallopoietes TaxID=37928 RepID=A0A1H1APW5_9MICC|nr:ABC transporter ATP-binding protein [Arthrobacter crystallopoietes]AUI51440.1 glutathione ABC transporter ATP-binding protein [Arthrobacter crystallopoietes]SDQ41793.1 peptide/nickel transport system ATP-binding protein [Arthrobacter crystallopoietes]
MDRTANNGRLLEVAGLSVTTKDRTLVSDFNLVMDRGERVGLIGESGSGKSMTTTALMGLLPEGVRASGSIRLAGHDGDLVTASDKQLRRIRGNDMTMVFQEPLTALNPLMKVGPQVAEIMLKHKSVSGRAAASAKAVELLAGVKLPDPGEAAKAYPHQLSGGQRQRVMLAMALANDPALLLCDEPTTALDVTVQRQVLDLILESVQQRGTGLLFITHDLSVVANVCDRVLVMNNGQVVEEGSTEDVFSRPRHPYTRGLLAASDLDATDADGRLFTVASAAAYVPPVPEQVVAEVPKAALHVPEAGPAARAEDSVPAAPDSAEVPVDLGEPARTEPSIAEPAAAVGSPVISVKDLVRTYQRQRTSLFGKPTEVQALRGVSFDVAAGQRFGVVGESGSGKSTLLRILAGLDQPTSGSVRVAGNEVAGAKESELAQLRQQLQIVFQDPMGSLDPRMRVQDIIAEPLLAPGQKVDSARQRKLVGEMLSAVGLPVDAAERFPHQFSGGQRQRISIARALICQPRVLVADEPVSALDVSVRAQVLNLLSDLVDEYQLTLVFVSHDLGVVRYICDNVVVMNKGRIVESGSTSQIYEAPRHEYTRTLVNSSMSLRSELATREAALSR